MTSPDVILRDADERRARLSPPWRSLEPGRAAAHTLSELGELYLAREPTDVGRSVAHGLARLSDAICEHFPENVFSDLDAITGALRLEARRSSANVREMGDLLVALHELYGRSTTIRFRYVHDFLYGFDWSRWVAAEPTQRAAEAPFGIGFLSYSLGRGRELLDLIAKNDDKYHPLAAGDTRSPFPFRRDPDAEVAILLALARASEISVPAWQVEPQARWGEPFAELRVERARALGLLVAAR